MIDMCCMSSDLYFYFEQFIKADFLRPGIYLLLMLAVIRDCTLFIYVFNNLNHIHFKI